MIKRDYGGHLVLAPENLKTSKPVFLPLLMHGLLQILSSSCSIEMVFIPFLCESCKWRVRESGGGLRNDSLRKASS